VFDEPTAALGSEDVERLFDVIRQLRSRGLGIVYISHRIAELPRLTDRVTVLRDGKVVGKKKIDQCKVSDLTRMMLGHDLAEVFPEKTNKPGKTILEVSGLSRPGAFENISFELRCGEILGIAGLVGSGRTEIVRAILGAEKAAGTVEFQGRTILKRSPALCRDLGIGMVPEDRKRQGSITGRTVSENVNITVLDRLAGALGFQSPKALVASANRIVQQMKIDPARPRASIQTLSGGNQQKVIVGRWLAAESKVLIFDEPTQGIDVGTKSQVYRLIMDLACNGRAIILISSELLEIAKLADRILVIRNGRLVRELPGPGTDEDTLFAECVERTLNSPTFLSWGNIVDNLLTNAAAIGVIAIGMTFVMIAGGFDLSVASTTAVCSVVLVMVTDALSPYGPAVAITAGLLATALVGVGLGATNGVLIAYVGVNPFVVTLSTMLVFRGLALILTGGGQAMQVQDINLRNQFNWIYDAQLPLFGQGYQVSMPIVIFLVVFCVGIYLLRFTRFGHYIYAIGGNEEAAWLAGVNTPKIKATAYMMCGFTCAVAAAIFLAMTSTAQPESHMGRELVVIASVIVGGTPLGGGSGGLVCTLIGLLLLRVIEHLLTQFGIGAEYRPVVTGLIIVIVVTVDVLAKRRSGK
jgi:ribose/xylose/arabinose/galactoside ABC-type transport system permease subunit/ABC-type dipeptide/oligopeptide/nickel transport system ATPase component